MRTNVTNLKSAVCSVPCFKTDVVARLRRGLPTDAEFEAVRAVFAALAEPARLKILHALKGGEELCVCDVANVLEMSVSSTSHHLRRLKELGILKYRSDGKMAYYSLQNRNAADIAKRGLAAVRT